VNGLSEPAPGGGMSNGRQRLGVRIAPTEQATDDIVRRVSGDCFGPFYLRAE